MSTKPVAGDTVWIHGGTYSTGLGNRFFAQKNGTAAQPIIFRNYNNESVIIDCSATDLGGQVNSGQCFGSFNNGGQYNWFWGLQFMNPLTVETRLSTVPGSSGTGIPAGTPLMDIELTGEGVRYINCFSHNNINGFHTSASWGTAGKKIVYGNHIQYSGWVGPDRGHGHSLYIAHATAGGEASRVMLQDNIAVRDLAEGGHSYTEGGQVGYISYDHNVFSAMGHQPGTLTWQSADGITTSLLYGANGSVATNCDPVTNPKVALSPVINGNWTYGESGTALGLGYTKGSCNGSVTGNVFANIGGAVTFTGVVGTGPPPNGNGCPVGEMCGTYPPLTITGNTFYATPNGSGGPAATFTAANYPSNTYLTAFPSSGDSVSCRPNQYESGRGFCVFHNWDLSATVSFDAAAAGMYSGQQYKIYGYEDANPWTGTPLATGTWNGSGNITVNIASPTVEVPTGDLPAPGSTWPQFGVLIVYPDWSAGATPTPTNTNTPTHTPTFTFTPSLTPTPATPTFTATFTATGLPSNTPTFTASQTPTNTPTPSPLSMSFQAEACALTSPMRVVADADASGGFYVDSTVGDTTNPIDGEGGILTCTFTVPTTTSYRVWARVYAATASEDSFYVEANSEGVTNSTRIFDIAESQQPCTGNPPCQIERTWDTFYHWNRVNSREATCGSCSGSGTERVFSLTAGTNTLKFYSREVGARLDYIIITSDMNYDPSGTPGAPTPTPTPGSRKHRHTCNGKTGYHAHDGPIQHTHKPCPWR